MRGRSAVRAAMGAFVALSVAGCGQRPSSPQGAGSTAAAVTSRSVPKGTYEVVAFGPTTGPASSTAALKVTFSKPVDPRLVRLYATTWLAVEALGTQPGGSYVTIGGTLSLDATGTQATFTPNAPFRARHEVRLLIGANLAGAAGETLVTGSVGARPAFTNVMQDEVFESYFMPTIP